MLAHLANRNDQAGRLVSCGKFKGSSNMSKEVSGSMGETEQFLTH